MKSYRRLPLTGAKNTRDLGGYPAKGNKITKYHVWYRSDNLHSLTDSDWELLKQANVKIIIDLRSSAERSMQGYDAQAYGIDCFALPLLQENPSLDSAKEVLQNTFVQSMELDYVSMVKENIHNIIEILKKMAEAVKQGAVLFHCSAGKDRTGIISALLLWNAGVAGSDIIADYQVTKTYITDVDNELFQMVPEAVIASHPNTMAKLLDFFEEEHILSLLKERGLDEAVLTSLHEALLENDE